MKISKYKFEKILKECNFIVGKIHKDWYLVRMYGSKKHHPIGYYILFPVKLTIEWMYYLKYNKFLKG